MNHKFAELMEVIDKNLKYSGWANSQSVQSCLLELESEVKELEVGLRNQDKDNIIEEVADILYDSLMLARLAQREHNVKMSALMEKSIQKLRMRKPYIFEESHVTLEEEKRLWKEEKANEGKIEKNCKTVNS